MKKKILLFLFLAIISILGITNIYAVEDKYNGDYTIEYLLRHYNVVTLGTQDRYQHTQIDADLFEKKGSVIDVFDIGGPVLIRGNYKGNLENKEGYLNEFAQKTNKVPSFIKGEIGSNISPGSKESADVSDIYVGSTNTISENKFNGNENKYNYPIKSSDNYLDFDKLYEAVVDEQKKIYYGDKLVIDQAISSNQVVYSIVIDKPGIYYIRELGVVRSIRIENYNPNELYVITYDGEFVHRLPEVYFDSQYNATSSEAVYCGRDDSKDTCTGNLVWNLPNARYIYVSYNSKGHIIAPNADIELDEDHYSQAIIANSITAERQTYTALQFSPYNLNTKLTTIESENYIDNSDDDIYDGDYTIEELLRNYSVVTLGQSDYGDETKLSTLNAHKGTASLFHIGGQFLISGDLGYENVEFTNKDNSKYGSSVRLDFRRRDLDSHSFLKGDIKTNAWQPDAYIRNARFSFYIGNSNQYYTNVYEDRVLVGISKETNHQSTFQVGLPQNWIYECFINEEGNTTNTLCQNNYSYNSDNYIDFSKLYKSIVEKQKEIDEGELKKADENGNLHLKIGGNYVIETLDDVNTIIFENFEKNSNKLTIITIKASENINFPKVGYGSNNSNSFMMVPTNDWIGGYTYNGLGQKWTNEEKYFGNIVWNIPNASYIKLAEDAPFFGHIIAPNADMETPELHFAGAAIVNSLYAEGNTEAHFYPLSVDDDLFRKLDRIDISGTKTWDDKNNQDRLRPDSITINLLADGEKIDSVTITEDDDWKYEFKNLVKENGNGEINYTITEDAVENYATEIDGYNITNSYTPEKTSLTVNKVWKDENDKDKIRPESIEVELYANGDIVDTAELNEENDWMYIFTEIDMYSEGKRIEYTIKEKNVKGYTTEITGDQETGYTIINTHKVKEVKPEKDNPVTYDNVSKFAIISVITTLFLVIGIIVYQKNKKED